MHLLHLLQDQRFSLIWPNAILYKRKQNILNRNTIILVYSSNYELAKHVTQLIYWMKIIDTTRSRRHPADYWKEVYTVSYASMRASSATNQLVRRCWLVNVFAGRFAWMISAQTQHWNYFILYNCTNSEYDFYC